MAYNVSYSTFVKKEKKIKKLKLMPKEIIE